MAGSSSAVIGSISSLSGGGASSVCVQGVDVIERTLDAESELRADEILRVPQGTELSITLVDGSEVVLQGQANGREIALDRAGIAQLRQETAQLDASSDDSGGDGIDALQAALLAGADPSQLEATAAGPGNGGPGNEGGTSFVRIDRNGGRGQVDPSALDTDAAGEPAFPLIAQSEVFVPPGLDPTFTAPGLTPEDPEVPEPPVVPPPVVEPPVVEPPVQEATRNPQAIIQTNTSNNSSQIMMFTFTQGDNQFWTLLDLASQGGGRPSNDQYIDIGFDIDLQATADISLEWISGDDIRVTSASVNGIAIGSQQDGWPGVNGLPSLINSADNRATPGEGDAYGITIDYANATADSSSASLSFSRYVDADDSDGLQGTADNDLLITTGNLDFDVAGTLQGGQGIDQLLAQMSGSIDLGDAAFSNSSLEIINLGIDPNNADGDTASTLALNANDVLGLGSDSTTGAYQLYILGDEDDTVALTDGGQWDEIVRSAPDGAQTDNGADGFIGLTQTLDGGEVINLYIQTGIQLNESGTE